MEWIETTGRTVAEALDAALDELGVDERDAEILIVAEPRGGLFGLGRSEARVRARVRPATPRPKRSQRDRTRSSRSRSAARPGEEADGEREAPARQSGARKGSSTAQAPAKAGSRRRRGGRGRRPASERAEARTIEEEPMSVEEQVSAVSAFVEGVVERFGFAASTSVRVEGENLIVDVNGEDLGLLIGPRGATLDALQELARTVSHRRADEPGLRVIVDVAGFRQRRAAALESFARRRGEEVLASGVAEALEPMSAADRKIVHDTIALLGGLETLSEGAEPNRYVVIRPAPENAPALTDAGG